MKINKVLWVLIFIAVINSMGFGIIIPLIFSYGKKFGVTPQIVGLLTAVFSVGQFFATPILGKLSDRFGRKPLLIISLLGTCASFLLFGLAGSLWMLFIARALDGITGGNISVAQAVVSDISGEKDRAKNFGLLGSAFGFGYVIGPAAGGLLSKLGMQVPFYFGAGMALLGVLLTLFLLKETRKKSGANQKKDAKSMLDLAPLVTILKKPVIGKAVMAGFWLTMAQFAMLIGFQTFCAQTLKLSATQTGIFYAGFGVTGILMQLAVPWLSKWISSKTWILLISTMCCLGAILLAGLVNTFLPFAAGVALYGLFNGLRNPMLNAIISDEIKESEHGEVMGVNQSYIAIGQTLGPLAAGLITAISVHSIFFLSGGFILAGLYFAFGTRAKHPVQNKR